MHRTKERQAFYVKSSSFTRVMESGENGQRTHPCMTALAWGHCAWAPLLFPAAPPRTAALQSQTGNPWCWSAAGWPPDQGALTPQPVPLRWVPPAGVRRDRWVLPREPWKWRFQKGENILVVLSSWESSQWGDLCSVKCVKGCRSHGSPGVEVQDI